MENQDPNEQSPEKIKGKSRPLGLAVLLIFSFVYNGLLLFVMVLGLFSTEIVQDILQQYNKQIFIPDYAALAITIGGTIIFSASIFGLILLWLMRRTGFYFYATSQAIMLASLVFILKSFDLVNISIAVAVIVIIGLHARTMK